MTFTILPLAPQAQAVGYDQHRPSSPGADFDGDIDMDVDEAEAPFKRIKFSNSSVVTPGESVTDDPQWMRYLVNNLP